MGDFNFKEFLKSKLFIGMILVVLLAIIYPLIGFIPSCFLFIIAYGVLLGERNPLKLILFSAIITIIVYVIFQGALDILLARGSIKPFKAFARFCEKLLPF